MDDRDVARVNQGDGAEGVTSPPVSRQAEKTRIFSQEPLVAEVRAIYAGLAMVESKCIEVDKTLRPLYKPGGNPWHHLNAFYDTLLHGPRDFILLQWHHDSFLAPRVYPTLRTRTVAAKDAMPAHDYDWVWSLIDSKRRRYGLLPPRCFLLFDADNIDVAGWQSKTTTWMVVKKPGRKTKRQAVASPSPAH
jgi:hypothetical protein